MFKFYTSSKAHQTPLTLVRALPFPMLIISLVCKYYPIPISDVEVGDYSYFDKQHWESEILHNEPNIVRIDGFGADSRIVVVGDIHGLHDFIFLLGDTSFPANNMILADLWLMTLQVDCKLGLERNALADSRNT
ncbi:hypothetical protein Vadar_031675 [Vaccinium darrowii]|uniref:Uncharacterized protein n=1 Tax=Vaccinium darrowii TaxID=229202 RepID=A0ACB7XLL2_9ERIC|nr:hypothetical protein Vadar_031675 [Vaccinium darrowii]